MAIADVLLLLLPNALAALAINIFFRKSFSFATNSLQFVLVLLLLLLLLLAEDRVTAAPAAAAAATFFLVAAAAAAAVAASFGTDLLRNQHLLMRSTDAQDLFNFLASLAFVVFFREMSQKAARLAADGGGGGPSSSAAAAAAAAAACQDLLSRRGWATVPILSLLQLTRNPLRLKEFLRPYRVACGPASILTAVGIGWLQVCILHDASYCN